MADLFGRDRTVITKHIRNIFTENELDEDCNVQILHFANSDKPVKLFSLDVIISVGYRVKSVQGTKFRQWANKIIVGNSACMYVSVRIIGGNVYLCKLLN